MDPPGNFNPFNLSISSTGTITTVYPYDVTLVLSAVVNLGRGLASYRPIIASCICPEPRKLTIPSPTSLCLKLYRPFARVKIFSIVLSNFHISEYNVICFPIFSELATK